VRQASSTSCSSPRPATPASSSACSASTARSLPTGSPALRNTRAKCSTLSASRPACGGCDARSGSMSIPLGSGHCPLRGGRCVADPLEDPRGLGVSHPGEIVLVFQEHSQRVVDRLRVKRRSIEGEQRASPFYGLRQPRQLVELETAQVANELDDLPGQCFLHMRHAAADDLELTG